MNDLYYNKYLKYKNKYLELKHGGLVPPKSGVYIPPHRLNPLPIPKKIYNFYIYINPIAYDDIYFKDPLCEKLIENGHIESESKVASFVYLHGYDQYPQMTKSESKEDFKKRVKEYREQFPSIEWINLLWGEHKDIITNKVKFPEYFGDKLKKYLSPWDIIREKDKGRNEDICKIKFKEGTPRLLKPSNSYRSKGTKVVYNQKDITDHIEEYDSKLLYPAPYLYPAHANNWIVEDIISQDKINERNFFIRVHILVILSNKQIKVYISNKHPFFIQKKEIKECPDGFLSNECIDNDVGSNLYIPINRGGGPGVNIDKNGKNVIYNFDDNPYWPKNYPDGYNEKDIKDVDTQIYDMFKIIFSDKKINDLKPDYKSPNGFHIYGCDVSLQNKNIILHEINRRTGLIHQAPFIEDIMDIINNKDSFRNFNKLEIKPVIWKNPLSFEEWKLVPNRR